MIQQPQAIRLLFYTRCARVPYEVGPRRAGDAPVLVANSDKLQRTLGWKPRYPELTDIVATAWQFEKNRRA